VGWRAAQKGGLAGCTTRQAIGLHIKLAYWKGRGGGLLFSAARPALFRNPVGYILWNNTKRRAGGPGGLEGRVAK